MTYTIGILIPQIAIAKARKSLMGFTRQFLHYTLPSIHSYIILPPLIEGAYPVATPLDSNEPAQAQYQSEGQ